ncbi:MAG TPA: ABC transporter substrate-binding protein [Acidimicrobiales bacterium]|nr:ABC transporter substrate-binding protein [Acidimicrobiales bacterium]
MRRGRTTFLVVAAAAALFVAACGDDSGGGGSSAKPLDKLGSGEGALNIIAWAGYAEDGSTDPNVDWVHPFEDQTGCKMNVKIGNTSDEMVQLMSTGEYDGVSASGDATLRLIAAGQVAPVNTDLVPNYADVFPYLKEKPWNSVDGQMYGIPHGWGANILMWNTDVVTPEPDSWGAVFDPSSPYSGKVTAYDSPIYIADAALFLAKSKPELGITNPYALDKDQLAAAVDLLKGQKKILSEYWSLYTDEQTAFDNGTSVIGTTWQVITNLVDADGKVKVKAIVPKEGSTGWSDTWMISSKAAHPNCMYMWMNYIISPKVNAEMAEFYGEAPSNAKACAETADAGFCDTYHANDEAYASSLAYWTTPTKDCLDGRGDKCTTYQDWTTAWDEVKA